MNAPCTGVEHSSAQMATDKEFLTQLYDRFNSRDMEAVLAKLHPDVMWANGMEGGHVHGREGVRSYWTRQWAMIEPHVEPTGFSAGANGTTVVEVHQTVRDLQGNVLADRNVGHIFRIEGGLVVRFDIRE
jgi:ketosteroid isomerase-like protein